MKTTKNVSRETYRKVIDLLFFDAEQNNPSVISSLALRFQPSFQAESQILLVREENSARILFIKAGDNVYHTLNRMLQEGETEEAEKMARKISVVKNKLTVSPEKADKWIEMMTKSFPKTLEKIRAQEKMRIVESRAEVFLDGTFYEIDYKSQMNAFSLSLYDETTDGAEITGTFDSARISNTLRLEIEKMLPKETKQN